MLLRVVLMRNNNVMQYLSMHFLSIGNSRGVIHIDSLAFPHFGFTKNQAISYYNVADCYDQI